MTLSLDVGGLHLITYWGTARSVFPDKNAESGQAGRPSSPRSSLPTSSLPLGLIVGGQGQSWPCYDTPAIPAPHQVIDCSMAVQEEAKEPHVSSVLPWIILHRIIRQEEDTFHSLCHQQQLQNPAEEGMHRQQVRWGWALTHVSLPPASVPGPWGFVQVL